MAEGTADDAAATTAILVVTAVCGSFLTLVLLFRFIVRRSQSGWSWGYDDSGFCVAFLLVWACAASNLITVIHVRRVEEEWEQAERDGHSPETPLDWGTFMLAGQICFYAAATVAKAAVILFFRRLFRQNWVQKAAAVLLVLLGILLVGAVVFYAVQRRPSFIGNAAFGATNSFLGAATVAFAAAAICTLDLGISKKLVNIFWYTLGWTAVAASIARLLIISLPSASIDDIRWQLTLSLSIAEPTLWLVTGSIPTLRQFGKQSRQNSQEKTMQTADFEQQELRRQNGHEYDQDQDQDHADERGWGSFQSRHDPLLAPRVPENVRYNSTRPLTVEHSVVIWSPNSPRPSRPGSIQGLRRPVSKVLLTPGGSRPSSTRTGMYTRWWNEEDGERDRSRDISRDISRERSRERDRDRNRDKDGDRDRNKDGDGDKDGERNDTPGHAQMMYEYMRARVPR